MEDLTSKVVIQDIAPSSDRLQFIILKDSQDSVTDQRQYNQANSCDIDEGQNTNSGIFVQSTPSKVGEEFFRCDVCDTDFESLKDLQQHANVVHLDIPAAIPLSDTVPRPKVCEH